MSLYAHPRIYFNVQVCWKTCLLTSQTKKRESMVMFETNETYIFITLLRPLKSGERIRKGDHRVIKGNITTYREVEFSIAFLYVLQYLPYLFYSLQIMPTICCTQMVDKTEGKTQDDRQVH